MIESGLDADGNGELANAEVTDQQTLCTVSVKQLAPANYYYDATCALLTDGSVYCWGSQYEQYWGDGTTAPRPTPKRVEGLPPTESIVLSASEAHALTRDGSVYWIGESNSCRGIHPPSPR